MPRRRKDIEFDESLFNNVSDFNVYRDRLFDLACGSFNFENVPTEVYMPFVVSKLIRNGQILAFKDDVLNRFYLYPFTTNGTLNEYGIPFQRRVTLQNIGATYILDDTNSVILRTNVSRTKLWNVIEFFARNMYLLNRIIQININAQKTPVILTCDENMRLTYENVLKQYDGNVTAIFGSKDLDINNLKAITLNAPLVAPQLYQMLANYWNEFLTFFGIPNVALNKKERLITDEVQRSMGGIIIAKQNFENEIQRGVDEINKMFGMDIKFTWGIKEENLPNNDNMGYNENKFEVNEITDNEEGGEE